MAGQVNSPAQPEATSGGTQDVVVHLAPSAAVTLMAGLLATFAILALVQAVPDALTMVAVGTLLALALDPLVSRTRQRLRCTRATAVAVVGGALAVLFATVALALGPAAIDEAGGLASSLPETVEKTYSWPVAGPRLERAEAATKVSDFVDQLPGRVDDKALSRLAEAALGGLVSFAVVLIVAVAVLVDGESLVARARRIVRPDQRERADEIGRIAYRTIGSYFAGSLTVAVLNGVVMLSAALVLGVPLAPLVGLWAALTNLIPQVGGLLGGGFFVVLAITQGPVTGLIAIVLYLVYQQIENNVIQPAIIGKRVNLSPPVTMLAALMGGAAAGVPGALAATPLVGTVKAIASELRDRRRPNSTTDNH